VSAQRLRLIKAWKLVNGDEPSPLSLRRVFCRMPWARPRRPWSALTSADPGVSRHR